MTRVLETLLPLGLVLGLGMALARTGFFDQRFRKGLDRLVYWVGLPCLIVGSLSGKDLSGSGVGALLVVTLGATLAATAVAWGLALLMRLKPAQIGVMVQAGMRGNLVFVALPVIIFALDEDAGSTALLVIAPLVVLYNLVAVPALLLPQHQGIKDWRKLIRPLVTNPLVVSSLIGAGLSVAGMPLWEPLERSLLLVGRPAPALALISLGAALTVLPVRGELGKATAAAMVKLAVCPLVAWGLMLLLGVTGEQMLIGLILCATPTAVASYVLAGQLKGDEALAASCVVVTTTLSAVSLGVVVALAG